MIDIEVYGYVYNFENYTELANTVRGRLMKILPTDVHPPIPPTRISLPVLDRLIFVVHLSNIPFLQCRMKFSSRTHTAHEHVALQNTSTYVYTAWVWPNVSNNDRAILPYTYNDITNYHGTSSHAYRPHGTINNKIFFYTVL